MRGMSPVPVLEGGRVRLRPLRPSDREERRQLGRHADIVRSFGGDTPSSSLVSEAQAAAWYRSLEAEPLAWAVEVQGRLAGSIRLHGLNEHDRRASLAIGLLDPALLSRGLGTEATRLVLGHAFSELGLHRVSLRVLASNLRAIRCYEKCGFVHEGRERESGLVDGEWDDDLMMGILEDDWLRLDAASE